MKLFLILIFFIFYFFGLFNNNPEYSSMGAIFLFLSILTVSGLILFEKKIYYDKKINFIMLVSIVYPLFFSIYYYLNFDTLNDKYFYLLFQLAVIYFIFNLGCQLSAYKRYISYIIFLFMTFLVSLSFLFGKASIVGKENIYASILLILLAFVISSDLKKIIKILSIILVGFGIFFSDARSSLVAFSVMLLLYFFSKYIIKFKRILLFSVIAFSLFWISYIVHLYETGKGDSYNLLIYELTGKQLYSGREKMWGQFIDSIKDNPMLGYGLGVDYGSIANIEYSTHNLYLAILIQQGIVGLFLFIYLVYYLYIKSIKNYSNPSRNFIFLIIPVILLQQNFELSLTQNNLSIMVIFWFLIGIHSFSNKTDPSV
ncbi:O-antigen ligase [Acinetobacter sp. YH12090]|uniref:O-antigen ligase family protein n=1 Tax=Acinetobacter sp. YH12090 TaxID=2601081 RepID=UPI0015D3350F|nr:O-antigen ligase family protein [Acinetobacter sp. YH12090]